MDVALNVPATLAYAAAVGLLSVVAASSAARAAGLRRLGWLALAIAGGAEVGTAVWLTTLPQPDPDSAYLRAQGDPAYQSTSWPAGVTPPDVANEVVDRARIARADPLAMRVLFLGDSFTAGAGVPRDHAWPAVAGRLLAARGARVDVLNHAILGYSTFDELTLLDSWSKAFDPDVIVLGVLINDLDLRGASVSAGDTQADELLSPSSAWTPWPPLALATLRHVASLRSVGRQTEDNYARAWADPESLDTFADRVERIAAIAEAGGAKLVVVRVPLLHALDTDVFATQERVVRAQAGAVGAAYVDLFPTVRGLDASTLWVASFDHHPSEAVHARFAAPIADALAALALTPSPSGTTTPSPRALLGLASDTFDPSFSTADCKVRPAVSLTLAQIALANRDLVDEAERDVFTRDAVALSRYPTTRCAP